MSGDTSPERRPRYTPRTGKQAMRSMRGDAASMWRGVANPISLRGLVAAGAGTLVLLLPGVSTAIVQIIVVAVLGVSGILDVIYALVGKRWIGKRRNRVIAFLRGLITVLFVAILVLFMWIDTDGGTVSLQVVVSLTGLYVAIRGLFLLVSSIFRRGQEGQGPRIVGGVIALAGGGIAFWSPETLTDAIIVGGATLAIVVGLILVAWGLRRSSSHEAGLDPRTATLPEVLWDWIRGMDIGVGEREDLADSLYFDEPGRYAKLGAWWVMLVLSVAIATFAVLSDSTAVVIGAMLVAPLMQPIVGLAGALVNGWPHRALQAGLMVTLGVLVSIALSYGLAAWAPVAVSFDTNTQITSRVNPNVIDMCIAIAAGAAGAFATVNKRVSSSIAGVAIAVALVPPLAVVGICLGGGRFVDAGGAFLLFLTNFAAIVLSAALVFVLTGFAEHRRLQDNPMRVIGVLGPFVALAVVLLAPLVLSSQGLLTQATAERVAQRTVDQWLGEDPDFVVEDISIESGTVIVALRGSGDTPPPEDLKAALDEELTPPRALRLTVTPVEVTEIPAR
ncbi:DUF389 domain-containing protein [Demequina sp. SYSU T00068]|uniref:DUF389 domain-containing protein n=1 Tax=Demequina lignilytica TaxID=3051663 RepID=UPI00260DCBE8|nr:DUF389 domain-containing protein [Demequina sp. SYSU T00068]MDN4490691.1 DUF389 domain-containing protein [Demequina sp. SYSU T00068]